MNLRSQSTDQSGRERAHAIVLADVQPERLRWLSYGRLAAGKITVLEGDPGLGKSTLLCEWSARISRGDALPEGEPRSPRGVVLLSAEDGLGDTIRPRMEAAGADIDRIVALLTVPTMDGGVRLPTIPNDLPLVEKLIERFDAGLLIFDPLKSYLDPGINEFRDQDVRRALAPVAAMAERTGVAVLIVRHLNKNQGTSAIYRGGGSIGIIAAARFGLVLGADPDDKEVRVLAPVKGNLGLPPSSLTFRLESVPDTDVARLTWTGVSRHSAESLLVQADPAARTEREEATTWLRELLADGPLPGRVVRSAATREGIGRETLQRVKQQLAVERRRVGFGPGGSWVWSLPGDQRGPAAEDAAGHAAHIDHMEHMNHMKQTFVEPVPYGASGDGDVASAPALPGLEPAPWEQGAEDDDLSFLDGTCLDCGALLTGNRRYRCVDCQP